MKKFFLGILLCASISAVAQCPTPSGLFTTNITYYNALANWTPVAGADHYKIHYRVFGTTNWSNLGNIGANDSSRNLPLLQQSTCYEWQIMAFCDSTNQLGSGWSISDTFTTTSFIPAPFNPVVLNSVSNTLCNTSTNLYLRVSQASNEPDIGSSTTTSDGGFFNFQAFSAGDSVGYAVLTTNSQTISTSLKIGIFTGTNSAIINSYDSTGALIGFFMLENINPGIRVSSTSPSDGNNYTSGFVSDVYFTNFFVNPPFSGPLIFYSLLESELNDTVYYTTTINIDCPNNVKEEAAKNQKLLCVYDALGRVSSVTPNKMLFYFFSDGTVEKRVLIQK